MSDDDDYDDDDEYDEYDEIDDEYPEPGQGYVGDAETLLRRSIDIIATAPTMPLSSSPRIDRDEIIELLEEALQRLPDELRQARWMLKERQEFVAKTRREADELLEAARVRAERMVQRTEVVRAAEQRARQVMETAEADSRRLRHETEDFLDQRLGSFEILLDKLQKTVGAGPPTAVDRRRCRLPSTATSRRTTPPRGSSTRTAEWPSVASPVGQRRRAAPPAGHPPPRRPRPSPLADSTSTTRACAGRRRRRPSTLESSTLDDIVVTGTLTVRLARHMPALPAAAGGDVRIDVDERYAEPPAPPIDPEAFPIENGQLDLAPMVREEVLLGVARRPAVPRRLPRLCPMCGADLQVGPCGCDRRRATTAGPCWTSSAARRARRGPSLGACPPPTIGCDAARRCVEPGSCPR